MRKRSILAIIVALVLFLGVLWFAIASTIDKAHEPSRGILVVGTNTPFPPFEDRKGEELIGFDIDLAERLAKALGKRLVIKDFNEFDALLPGLQAGTLDMIASAVTIRDDRKEVVDFSDSYFDASQAIIANKGNSFIFSGNPADFTGYKVGYQKGTTSQSWVESHLLGKVKAGDLIPFGDLTVGLGLLRLGSVDLIIIDEPVARSFAKNNSDIIVAGTIETGEKYGLAVPKGDPKKILPTINKALKEMKETGEYDKLIQKWFGGQKP